MNSPEHRYLQRVIGLLCCIKSDELRLLNILSGNKFVILRSANLLYYVCYTVLMKPFRWPRAATTFLEDCMQPRHRMLASPVLVDDRKL